MAASQVILFTTKLFKLSLSLRAPASDEFQLTMVVITRLKAKPWWNKSSGSDGGYTSFRGALAGGKGLMLTVTLTTLWTSVTAVSARTSFRMMLILTADGACNTNRLYRRCSCTGSFVVRHWPR